MPTLLHFSRWAQLQRTLQPHFVPSLQSPRTFPRDGSQPNLPHPPNQGSQPPWSSPSSWLAPCHNLLGPPLSSINGQFHELSPPCKVLHKRPFRVTLWPKQCYQSQGKCARGKGAKEGRKTKSFRPRKAFSPPDGPPGKLASAKKIEENEAWKKRNGRSFLRKKKFPEFIQLYQVLYLLFQQKCKIRWGIDY